MKLNSVLLLLAVLVPLVSVFFYLISKGRSILKSTMMFLLVFVSFSGAFAYESLQDANVALAVQKVKRWIKPAVEKQASSQEERVQSAIPANNKVLLDAPIVSQMPELPRGCEVTSLAMLLQYAGIETDKLTLAREVKKNPAEYRFADGNIYFGDPNEGFVGNMYTYTEPGLGVYHKPIAELAERYLPGRIKDMTGTDLASLKAELSSGRPVWVITNTQYRKLDEVFFQTWHTPSGKVKVTTKEHSVLVTGFDEKYVYFNDPLSGEKNKKAPMLDFEQAWVQMGRQAITFLPN